MGGDFSLKILLGVLSGFCLDDLELALFAFFFTSLLLDGGLTSSLGALRLTGFAWM